MKLHFSALQNTVLDEEDNNHQLVAGKRRNGAQMQDIQNVVGGNCLTRDIKQQREYLNLYYNSAAGAVHWQDRMV